VTVLLVVGVSVVALGALILLLFPDRPGGKIAWQGVEVSSIGAGLPLIVVGIVAIGIAGGGVIGGGDGGGRDVAGKAQTTAVLKCPADLGASLPAERVADVESGAHDQIVIGPALSKTEPFGLRLTDGGETVGAITARFFPASGLFKIQSLVDADCHAAEAVSLAGKGRVDAIANYNDVRIDFAGRSYVLDMGSDSDIRLSFTNFVP
jgi:hypothetical protein